MVTKCRDELSTHYVETRQVLGTHFEFIQSTVLVVLVSEHVVFATRPCLMVVTLALELLRQVVQSLEPDNMKLTDVHSHTML